MDQLEATGQLPAVQPPRRFLPGPAEGGAGAGRRRALRIMLVAAVAVVVVVALWGVDTNATRGKVGRNVTLAGTSIAGLHRPELEAAVAALSATYQEAAVTVDAPDGGFQANAPELGLAVVQDRTVAGALTVGRTGNVAARIWGWARSFLSQRPAPVRISVDEKAMARIVTERDPKRTPPVEPSITVKDDKVVPKPGEPGRGISAPSVLGALEKAGPKGLPLRISVERDAVPPRFGLDAAPLRPRRRPAAGRPGRAAQRRRAAGNSGAGHGHGAAVGGAGLVQGGGGR